MTREVAGMDATQAQGFGCFPVFPVFRGRMPSKPALKRLPPKKRPRKAKAGSRGSAAADTILATLSADTLATKEAIERAGGVVSGQYLDPLGGKPLLLAVLPIEKVEPTP